MTDKSLITDVATRLEAQGEQTFVEFLRVPALSMGLFAAPPGHADTQQPHAEDEVYVVVRGRAVFDCRGQRTDVRAGSIIYVPAHEPHHFADITEDLQVVVVFAPPESSPTS